jgi:hypothetical protein
LAVGEETVARGRSHIACIAMKADVIVQIVMGLLLGFPLTLAVFWLLS